MTMQDPISDMFTRVRNALAVSKKTVKMPFSTIKSAIANVLVNEGYIKSWRQEDVGNNKTELEIELKYFNNQPVINSIKRVSKPSLRIYHSKDDMPVVNNGLGIAIVSTSKGVMTVQQAKKLNQGGEVLCVVD